LALAIGAIANQRALAHSLLVDAFVDPDGTVTVEAYYGDGRAVAGAVVRVRTADDEVIRTGQTDSEGRYVFKPSGFGPLAVEVIQAGHRGTAKIEREALEAAKAPSGPAPASQGAGISNQADQAGNPPSPSAKADTVRRPRRQRSNNLVAAVAGIALILAAAALWQVRSLSKRLERLSRSGGEASD